MLPLEERPPPKIAHQAAWVVVCRMVGMASTLVSNVLVARLLGPEGLGAFLIATTVLAFGVILALSGLSEAGLRFIAENLGRNDTRNAATYLKTTQRWASISSLLATFAVVLFMVGYAKYQGESQLNPSMIILVGIGVMVLTWQQLTAQLLRSLDNVRAASFFSGGQTGGPLSNLVFVIPLAVLYYGLIPISETQIMGLLAGSICVTLPLAFWELSRSGRSVFASDRSYEPRPLSSEQRAELINVALSMLGIQLLAFITTQSDIWIGGSLLSEHDLGLYGAAKRTQLIALMPLQMALMTIQASIPRLYAQGKVKELEKSYRTAITVAAIPALIGISLCVLFPSQVLTLIFGASFASASTIVVPLFVGLFALVFFGSPGDVLAMTGNHRLVLTVNIFSAIALVVCGAIGAYYGKAIGLAIGSSIAAVIQNGMLWWIAKKRLGVWTHFMLRGWSK
jgi:O-antigen/teichoic acid export membrane protein